MNTPASLREDHEKEIPELRRAIDVIGADPTLPSFERLMQSILGVLSNPNARLTDISRAIVRDYSLSLKLTRTANSALYNRAGERIRDLDRVMMLLGARVVREIAGSVTYFNAYGRKSEGLRELLMLSMLTAHIAREAAIAVRCEAPETSFLSGMFYNLGQVLVAAHLPEQFIEIRAAASRIEDPEREVVESVLGYDFAELGSRVGVRWGLPSEALKGMGRSSEDLLDNDRRVVRFSHELAVASFASPKEAKAGHLKRIQEGHCPLLKLDASNIEAFLKRSVLETTTMFADAGMNIDDVRLLSDATLAAKLFAEADERVQPGGDRVACRTPHNSQH